MVVGKCNRQVRQELPGLSMEVDVSLASFLVLGKTLCNRGL